jgi:hypothetical protein
MNGRLQPTQIPDMMCGHKREPTTSSPNWANFQAKTLCRNAAKMFFCNNLRNAIQFVVDAALGFGHVRSLYSRKRTDRAAKALIDFSTVLLEAPYDHYRRAGYFPA